MGESLGLGVDDDVQASEAVAVVGAEIGQHASDEQMSPAGPGDLDKFEIHGSITVDELAFSLRTLKLTAAEMRRHAATIPRLLRDADRLEADVGTRLEKLLILNGGKHLLDEIRDDLSHEYLQTHRRWRREPQES